MKALGVALVIAIGASGCYLAHEREASCTAAPVVAPCPSWRAAAPSIEISDRVTLSGGIELTSAIATDCGVLASWYVLSGPPRYDTLSFETRTIAWTGEPIAPALAHPSLTVTTMASGSMELARGATTVGAMITTSPGGCRFLSLDSTGAERGPVMAEPGGWCQALEPLDDGFSFLRTSSTGTTPGTLVTVSADGAERATSPLVMPSGRALWSRNRFADGSFLLYSFREDPMTAVYSGWVQHFDARGVSLADEVPFTENGVPLLMASATSGALSAWETATPGGLPMRVRPIDRDGHATGGARDLPASGAQYGMMLASVPNGDVLAVWTEDHSMEQPEWRILALALAPDGSPRADATTLLTGVNPEHPQVVVDPSGGRALFVYGDDGMRALPIECVR